MFSVLFCAVRDASLAQHPHLRPNRPAPRSYARIISPELRHASKPAMFLNCLYKALKDDSDAARAAAFVKRALQVRCPAGCPPPSALRL